MTRYLLNNEQARKAALYAVEAAPMWFVCEVKERTRTADQNAALHAMLADIAKQKEWAGKKRSLDYWKTLMVSGHRVVQNEESELTVGLEGELVQMREPTSKMGVSKLSSLIDYLSAWCAANDVRLSAPASMGERNG